MSLIRRCLQWMKDIINKQVIMFFIFQNIMMIVDLIGLAMFASGVILKIPGIGIVDQSVIWKLY